MVKLIFKATKNYRAHRDLQVTFSNGETKEVNDGHAKGLLEDYPQNFAVVTGKDSPAKEVKEVKEPETSIETTPDKMVNEAKPKTKKKF